MSWLEGWILSVPGGAEKNKQRQVQEQRQIRGFFPFGKLRVRMTVGECMTAGRGNRWAW
jgi:hypothetical protein